MSWGLIGWEVGAPFRTPRRCAPEIANPCGIRDSSCLIVKGGREPPFHTFPPVRRAANHVRCHLFFCVWQHACASAKARERRPLVGIARERETRADDPALRRRECHTLSQSRMVRPLTACQQRKRAVLRWCWAHGYVEQNVAGEGIEGALPALPAVKAHFRALPYREVAAALETVDGSKATRAAKLCLRFLILAAARSGEARGARWSEIDTEAREWRIRATGRRRERLIGSPSPEAMAVLERARALDDRSGLVFPGRQRGRELSNMTLTKILRDDGLADQATVHGFRSAFRDWCAETGAPREVAEAALAHMVGGVEGAYFRSDLFERRRALMESWGAFLTD